MTITEGPNTASAWSMSNTEPRVQLAVEPTAVSNPGILPEVLQLRPPVAPTESNLTQLPLVGPSMSVFCKKTGVLLSTHCADGRSITLQIRKLGTFESIFIQEYYSY